MPKGKRMPTVMRHQFSRVPQAEIQRSQFDRSCGYKTTFNAGLLIPVFVDEALPGDTFNLRMTGFARLATPIVPLMDNLYLDTFFFAVPYRLVWTNWERFMGAQDNPGDSTAFVIPQSTSYAVAALSLGDYMGLPVGPLLEHSSLFHRAYALIWNEWFRDENLQASIVVPKGDGPDNLAVGQPLGDLNRRGKRHDYFTSCLPFPQKGTDVLLPLGATAPVVPLAPGQPTLAEVGFAGSPAAIYTQAAGVGSPVGWGAAVAAQGNLNLAWDNPALEVDLSSATAATINDLREAFQIQRLLERDARGGTRYVEMVKAHFGVTSPDARLQRPEYLGGGSTPVIISPIAQTSSTDVTTPQGNLAAMGTAGVSGHGFVKSFTEHCLLIGMVSVRADLTYQKGVERMWSRRTRFDFYFPALAHLGEQAVLNKEIFAQGVAADDDVFGYQERFAEYRYKPSQITGQFRSNHPQTLDIWHLSQSFTALPTLGDTFIRDVPPIDRVIAVPSEPHFLFDSYFSIRCARPMPVFGVPGLIDHF